MKSRFTNKIGVTLLHIFFIVLSLSFVVPMWSIIAISMSNETDIINFGYKLIPHKVDMTAYSYIFNNSQKLINAYKITIITSLASLVLYLAIASLCAYALSQNRFKFRKQVNIYLFFTMLFNGGLVPFYILVTKYLQLRNSYWALILPQIGNVWYVFLMRTFFKQLPGSIIESANIDGANEFKIFARIVLPLSMPSLATVGLLSLLTYWNSWFHALLFVDKQNLYPLQYFLQVMLRSMQELVMDMNNGIAGNMQMQSIPTESVRMAMCICAIAPMMFVFPFFQKYFVKGLTVGAVKE